MYSFSVVAVPHTIFRKRSSDRLAVLNSPNNFFCWHELWKSGSVRIFCETEYIVTSWACCFQLQSYRSESWCSYVANLILPYRFLALFCHSRKKGILFEPHEQLFWGFLQGRLVCIVHGLTLFFKATIPICLSLYIIPSRLISSISSQT